ncbi:seipin-like [Lampris incognitus]|uniref:seipin-like n=1 Tax=Lampris incognitus TaxID=2546036 RepID=UPI0024B62CE7|nr:seipin-like [Lampris incognitus]
MDHGSEARFASNDHRESVSEWSFFVAAVLLQLQDAVAQAMLRIRLRLLQGTVMLCSLFLLVWTATFLYGSFYYFYMPNAVYHTPVHFYYRSDCESSASHLCSYPTANISMQRNSKNQVMVFGQSYRISLELDVPDSPANQELGMFMIRMTCYSAEGRVVVSSLRSATQLLTASSSRFTMLRYRSDLVRTAEMLLFLPAYVTGVAKQKQLLQVELFSDYTDNPYSPSVRAIVEILSSRVQIYSAQLYVHAHFTGITYLLFEFPLMSALLGICSNVIFLSFMLLFSYTRLLLGVTRTTQQSITNRHISEGMMDNSHREEDRAGAPNSLADIPVLRDRLHTRPTAVVQQGPNLLADSTIRHKMGPKQASTVTEEEAEDIKKSLNFMPEEIANISKQQKQLIMDLTGEIKDLRRQNDDKD